jgi:hypothetical protein
MGFATMLKACSEHCAVSVNGTSGEVLALRAAAASNRGADAYCGNAGKALAVRTAAAFQGFSKCGKRARFLATERLGFNGLRSCQCLLSLMDPIDQRERFEDQMRLAVKRR